MELDKLTNVFSLFFSPFQPLDSCRTVVAAKLASQSVIGTTHLLARMRWILLPEQSPAQGRLNAGEMIPARRWPLLNRLCWRDQCSASCRRYRYECAGRESSAFGCTQTACRTSCSVAVMDHHLQLPFPFKKRNLVWNTNNDPVS